MDIKISTIQLYEIIRDKADKETAENVVSALQNTIQEEVKQETTNQIKDIKLELVDRIHQAKLQTILWVVGVGIVQIVIKYLFGI